MDQGLCRTLSTVADGSSFRSALPRSQHLRSTGAGAKMASGQDSHGHCYTLASAFQCPQLPPFTSKHCSALPESSPTTSLPDSLLLQNNAHVIESVLEDFTCAVLFYLPHSFVRPACIERVSYAVRGTAGEEAQGPRGVGCRSVILHTGQVKGGWKATKKQSLTSRKDENLHPFVTSIRTSYPGGGLREQKQQSGFI